MPVVKARAARKPKKKSCPVAGQLFQNFNNSSDAKDTSANWRTQFLIDHHNISPVLARVAAALIYGEALDD